MKRIKYISQRVLIAGCMLYTVVTLITGCATPNPSAGQVAVITNPNTGVSTTNVEPAYIPNQAVTSLVNTASAIAPLVPAPYGTLLTALLALTTAAAGGVAAWKNNKATGLTSQLTSVIQGVEAATTAADGTNLPMVTGAAVKASIQSHATAAGVQPALNATVQKVTA